MITTSSQAAAQRRPCTHRSGLTCLQLALMGKGVMRAFRPLRADEADARADRRKGGAR